MKRIVRIRRRDGVTQRYRIGITPRARIRKMAADPAEVKRVYEKGKRADFEDMEVFDHLSEKQRKQLTAYLDTKEEMEQEYGLGTNPYIDKAVRKALVAAKQARRKGKNWKETDSPGWKAYSELNPEKAKKIKEELQED